MRALWVADKLGYADRMHGVGAYFKYVLPAMPSGSVIPVVLRCSDQLDRQLASAGVSLRRLQHMKMDPRTLVSLLRIIRREQIDLLHLHGYGASTFGRLAARLTGRPAIIHQHDSIRDAPWYGRAADRGLSRWTYCALAVSEPVAEYCVEARSMSRDKVNVLVNAVPAPEPHSETTLKAWREELAIPRDARLVGSLTRLTPEKGTRYLIQAWPELLKREPRAILLLFGDDDDRRGLRQ